MEIDITPCKGKNVLEIENQINVVSVLPFDIEEEVHYDFFFYYGFKNVPVGKL